MFWSQNISLIILLKVYPFQDILKLHTDSLTPNTQFEQNENATNGYALTDSIFKCLAHMFPLYSVFLRILILFLLRPIDPFFSPSSPVKRKINLASPMCYLITKSEGHLAPDGE